MEDHILTTELDSAKDAEFDFFVGEREMLNDLKAMMREYYVATFTEDESALTVGFNNGQKFLVTVKAVR